MRGRLRLSRPFPNRKIQNQSFRLRRFPSPTCLKALRPRRLRPGRQAIRPILILKAEAFRIRTNKALKINGKNISHEKSDIVY